MFKNAGGKLGLILKILCCIEMLGVFAIGIICISENMEEIGIPIMIAGPVLVWVFSLYLIGMCDMMRDVYQIKTMLKNSPEYGKYLYNRNMSANPMVNNIPSSNSGNGNAVFSAVGDSFATDEQAQAYNYVPSDIPKFCPKCGMPAINPEQSFCSSCGATIE